MLWRGFCSTVDNCQMQLTIGIIKGKDTWKMTGSCYLPLPTVSELPGVEKFVFFKSILGDSDDHSGLTNTGYL